MISDHTHTTFHPITLGRREIPAHADDIFDHPLRIHGCLLSRWGAGEFFQRTNSNIFAIEQITAGNAVLIQDGKEYLVHPGEVYLLRKKCNHVYKTGPAGFLHKRCMTLEGPILEPLLYATGLDHCDYVIPVSPTTVSYFLRTIYRLIKRKEGDYLSEASGLAYRLLIELGKVSRPTYPLPVQTAIDFMQRNLANHLTSEDIALRAGFSLTHFNRMFKKHTGVSPIAYFIRKKMSLAQYLLTQTPMSVKEVATATGYDDPLYFSAQFKKQIGASPSRYASRQME